MSARGWRWMGLLALIVAGWLCWRPLAATAWVNAGGLQLHRALLGSEDPPQRLAQACTCYQRALALHPGDRRALRQLVRVARAQGAEPTAVGLLPQEVAAGDALTRFQWGYRELERGDRAGAIAIWQTVPASERYFMNAGMVDYAQGRVDSALELYALSEAIDDGVTMRKKWMYADLCQACTRRGERDQAIDWCGRAVQVEESVWNLIYLGRAYLWDDQPQAAVDVLLRARAKRPKVPSTYLYLGRAYMAQGEWPEAREALEQGVSLRPDAADMYWDLAEVTQRLGDLEASYCGYQRALEHADTAEDREKARAAQAELGLSAIPDCQGRP